ncbi:benzoate-CoA ligase family protein [Actinokineospora sp. UTMC 2448]|uniref:benzoate-CoA ligase family protein n=1 Tax=Actinokineospora sp. UTMC 2448 TaxID=2268449 RepID=UPI002164D213|nr:benzoate-CoA ligase family protein [Actinokineospora sp. UTMC 2448]UVS81491.1 3-hydroxybenzoate--CoA/4-hydroxybenzoate--CoA ligase [Actinokineospora sp. UTMC 2448]
MTMSGTTAAAAHLVGQDLDHNLAVRFLDHNPGERTALITPDGATSYAELRALVNRAGNALRGLGVRKGDRVLIAMRDGVEYLAAWYGAQRIGAITVDVYNFLSPEEHRYNVDYLGPSIVVTDGDVVEAMRYAGARGSIVLGPHPHGLREDEHDFAELVGAQSAELEPTPVAATDIAMWKLTTGSTGKPKACRHYARSPWLSHEWFGRGVLDLGPDDVVLAVPKLFSGWARDLVGLYAMGAGATGVLFPERTTAERIFELVARHRPTVIVNVPTMIKAMLAHPGAEAADLSSVRMCLSAGEQLPAELHRRWLDTFGVDLLDCVGSTESFNAVICNRPGRARVGSLGQVIPHYEATIVDDSGAPLPDGEVGVLQVRGEPVGVDYWKAPEKTAQSFPAPNTLRTGDLFSRDADGFFYYRGRADDLLKVSGLYVAPTEIENCIATHPGVVACAVVGYTTADGLTATRAFVVPRTPVGAEEIQEHVKAHLASRKCPKEIRFVAALPETPTGKIDRNTLRAVA